MLTVTNPKLERMVRKTVAGMAHWAGSGPKGMACGDCQHLNPRGSLGYGCAQYTKMMDGLQPLQAIPRSTPSCKYFMERKRNAVQIESTAGSVPLTEQPGIAKRGG